ncbi:YnfU family zinc-binding protein [Erwinia persicina]|uniref:YnfU family zinc-binding protein n=1 Tax=Erwinia persicina TaxID=55211 RepID=UPI000A8E3C42|nr:YnfU family zinc-binding protein [Erwinia persicina]QZQ48331.1 YnfU family zinc-binding protein [Erwinia persicina]
MSFINDVMKRLSSATASTTQAVCPVCGHRSSHAAIKIRQQKTLLCPSCKSLFVVPHS